MFNVQVTRESGGVIACGIVAGPYATRREAKEVMDRLAKTDGNGSVGDANPCSKWKIIDDSKADKKQ
jgi:hypothetical protein